LTNSLKNGIFMSMEKSWWDSLVKKYPGMEKYPASIAKSFVEKAQNDDAVAIQWLKDNNLWPKIEEILP
jgi:muramidase (phage lysozyme)